MGFLFNTRRSAPGLVSLIRTEYTFYRDKKITNRMKKLACFVKMVFVEREEVQSLTAWRLREERLGVQHMQGLSGVTNSELFFINKK